jgi:hypothetical protein
MPWYLVERTYPVNGETSPLAAVRCAVIDTEFLANNRRSGVTWLQSFVTPDRKKSYCLYEAPDPQALRLASQLNGEPIDRINEIRVWSTLLEK